jgi:putative ABC transport system permease protein
MLVSDHSSLLWRCASHWWIRRASAHSVSGFDRPDDGHDDALDALGRMMAADAAAEQAKQADGTDTAANADEEPSPTPGSMLARRDDYPTITLHARVREGTGPDDDIPHIRRSPFGVGEGEASQEPGDWKNGNARQEPTRDRNGSPPEWPPQHRKPGMFPAPPDEQDDAPRARSDEPPAGPSGNGHSAGPAAAVTDAEAEPAPQLQPAAPPRTDTVTDPAAGSRFEPPPDRSERLFTAVPPKEARSRTGLVGVRRALSSLLRQRRRIVLSTIIVALGIGYLAGSLSLLHRVGNGLANLSGAGTERSDLVLEGDISFDSPLEQVRNLIPDAVSQDVQQIAGVKAIDPRVESTAVIDGPNGPIVGFGITERPAAASWPTVDALNPYQFVGVGKAPLGDDEVVIDEATAQKGGIKVGDKVGVATKSTYKDYTVSGIVSLDGTSLPPGSSLALFDLPTARTLFEQQSDDNSIGIQLEPGASADAVAAQLRERMPPDVVVSTPAEYEAHRQTSMAKSFNLIKVLLLGFAVLAVVVGAFTVANSNALLFARRRHGFALLRLIGASPSQLLGAAVAEATLVGLAAVIIGVPLGLLAGYAIEHAIGALGTPIPTSGSAISVSVLAISAAVGIGVTILTALAPAWDAARTSAVQALTRNEEHVERGAPRFVRFAGWVIAGGLLGGVATAAISRAARPAAIGALCGAALFALLALLPPALSGIVGLTTRVMVGRSRTLRSLTALRSRRARSRAASTTAALLLATAVIAGLATLSSSFVKSLSSQVDSLVTADLVVDSGTFTRGGLPDHLITTLKHTDGVTAATGIGIGRATVNGVDGRFSGIDGDAVFHVLDLGLTNPPATLNDNEVVLSESFAQQAKVTKGSTITMDFSNTLQSATVVAVYPKSSTLLGDGIVTSSLLQRALPTNVDILGLVNVVDSPPAQKAAATKRVETLAAASGAKRVLPPDQLVSSRADDLRGFERVIEWMLLFSVLLAVVGVANTLQLSVNERRRELGLLRSVGASRRQVVRLVVVEAGALSVVGSILGIAIGVGGAYAAVQGLASLGLDQFAVPVVVVVAIAVAAVVLGSVGAFLPAMRASRAGIMEAIGEDDDLHPRWRRRLVRFRSEPASRTLEDGPPPADRIDGTTSPPVTPDAGSVEPEATTEHEEDEMAARCYNCGNDPGPGDRCEVCDASQIPEPLGMFSTAPAGAHSPPARGPRPREDERPSSGLWSTGDGDDGPAQDRNGRGLSDDDRFADIVDAAIVEDDDLTHSHSGGARNAPPQESGDRGTPLGSIFDDETAAQRSPFGRHANQDEGYEPDWGIDEQQPHNAPPAPPVQPNYPVPPPSYPPQPPHNPYAAPAYGAPTAAPNSPYYATPAAPQMDPFAQAGVGVPNTGPGGMPVTNDQQGLAASISKLSPNAQHLGNVAFCVVGGIIANDEVVLTAIQGWSLGMPTVAVLTNARVLIVSERRWKPVVEVFPLRPGLTIFGRHVDHQASVTFQEADRVITLDQVADVAIAVELATTARARSTGTGF